jgi:hypothetical protein
MVVLFTFNLSMAGVAFWRDIFDYEPEFTTHKFKCSGTTGTLLESIAQKNSEDHDPVFFIKQWLPELAEFQ